MKRQFLLALLGFALVFSGVAICAEDASADNETGGPITSLHGYVHELPPQENHQALAGVSVKTWASLDQEPLQEVTSDSDGSFTVRYESSLKYVTFTLEGYSVQSWCSELDRIGESNAYEIILKDDTAIDGVHELYDNYGVTALMARTNGAIFGTITTVIENRTVPVEGALINVISGQYNLTGTSDSTGHYHIDCPTGTTYDMTVVKGGLEDVTVSDVDPSLNTVTNIQMVQKSHTGLLGMDMAHTLALFGLLISVVVALFGIYMARKPEKENSIYVLNDLPESKNKKK